MTFRCFILTSSLIILFASSLPGQTPYPANATDGYFYRVYFTDKNANTWDYTQEQLLSPAAINRREKYGIVAPDMYDLPVNEQYISAVIQRGLAFKCASKWMNTALFASTVPVDEDTLMQLPFISRVQMVKHPADPAKGAYNKYGTTVAGSDPEAFDPRVPLNGNLLHLSGFTGRKVMIAVLDAGFYNADVIEALVPLHGRGGIVATHDFITGSGYVYSYHNHGTSVLSILAGQLPGIIAGTAPGADYLLLRTEDNTSEYPVEEDYWAAAAEYADSAGADIITSSLGYFTFDDPAMDYSFSDMDGNTTFIARAADRAASKGILVVSSAGNERNKEWIRIISPSDGDSVLCVGAIKPDLSISDFSSAGYSSDGQVKPDVVAPGTGIPIQFEQDLWYLGSGTSFSCPVISGLSASLMQAVPGASPAEIINALHESSDRFNNPDTLYGYGVPDFVEALRILEEQHIYRPEVIMTAGPNPFFDEINLWFREPAGSLSITITGTNGNMIRKWHYPVFAAHSIRLDGLEIPGQGVYVLKVVTDQGERVFRMVRLRR
jgi:hypothetical protein